MAFIEQVNLRTAKTKTFQDEQNPDIKRLIAYVSDVHYNDGSTWQEISESFENDTLTGFAHKVEKLKHIIHVGSTSTKRWMPRRNVPTEYIEFGRLQSYNGTTWGNVNLGTPVRSGNKITWTTTAFTLSLSVTWKKVKIYVVLKTIHRKISRNYYLSYQNYY